MNNVIDKIKVSGITYDIRDSSAATESAFTAYTAATDTRISTDEEVTAAALNDLNEAVSGLSESVSGKQDTLIAGDYITIDTANTISTSGLVTVADNEVSGQSVSVSDTWFPSGYQPTPINGDSYATSFDIVEDSINGGEYGQQCNYNTDIIITLIDSSGNTVSGSVGNGYITAATPSDIIPSNMTSYLDAQITIGERNGYVKYSGKNGWRIKYISDVPLGGLYTIGVYKATRIDFPGGQSARVIENTVFPELKELSQALSGKQDTLVSGTNIKTINNTSLLGSGNIDIQGGGKAIEAGRGISITTGETADTVSFNLPISAGTGTNSIAEGYNTTASGDYGSHAEGYITTASGSCSHAEGSYTVAMGGASHAEGYGTTASGSQSHAEGRYTIANNYVEHASGQYNVSSSASTTFGDSGNTLFSVGNGTGFNARHNAFEIRQNGDIYISSGNTDIKLQDHLGGGSITVDSALSPTSENPVENRVIYNKIDEVEEVTAAGLNALNDKITPTVELTQAQYDALVDKDPNTYYIITDAEAGDLTNYYTKTETNTLLGGKADTATTYTKTEVDTALGGKQPTLISGTNIKTINNESILGSGNIDIQGGGGGKAVSGGTNISITTGETADTINCTLPISADTRQYGTNLILFNYPNTINHNNTIGNFIVGYNNTFGNYYEQAQRNFVFGNTNTLEGYYQSRRCVNNFVVGHNNFFGSISAGYAVSNAAVFGDYNKPKNNYEYVFGQYNNSVSASTTFGDSGNTLFSVGNGATDNARHNAFEIRQNGDIYCSDGTNDVKLQDTITATAANTTALGGLSLVKLTQSAYDALVTKDNSTLYIIVN